MPDPELIREEMSRQVANIEQRLLYLEAMRTGVSQQGVAKQKLLQIQADQCDARKIETEKYQALRLERDGTGRECKARCDLLTLDIEELRLQLQRIKEQLGEMDKRVLIPNSGSMM